ncbi:MULTISPECIES: EamA family transporter RarD [unclassified Psychrobacter]|uniref:EamA family transporter RarD n=1 Tax=unclassified Psychrobacter TaxID=196806 RepID=UPI00071E8D9C|nr:MULTISPECIES: EamA family transporter RarD [unclassified Psychrobacter]OLF39394.1 permease [Psychrobacter sp. Cmf 22.2]
MLTTNQTFQGTVASVISSFLFAFMFLFGLFMMPLSGTQVASWRVLMMLLSLVLLVSFTKQWQHVFDYLKTLKTPKDWLLFILPTPILGGQIWLFMWGPVNGYGLDVTLGYFLLPLIMIVIGRFFYHERMSILQWVAALCAAMGVGYDIFQYGSISWVTLFACLGYPPYYLLRRKLAVPPVTGLLSDLALLTPVVLIMLYVSGGFSVAIQTSKFWYLLPLLGAFSALAMSLSMVASSKLPVSLFGALSYLEPMLLFVFSITILGQSLHEGGSLFMYGMITLALIFMIMESGLGYVTRRRDNRLHGYNEPQVGGFPPRRRLIDRRIDGVLKAHRFRRIRKYQSKIDKMQRKIERLDAK